MEKSNTHVIALIIALFFLSFLNFAPISSLEGSQTSFVLDLDSTTFNYTLNHFNNSHTTEEFDFNSSEDDHTFYVTLPKNSSVQNISMNLTGKITTIHTENFFVEPIHLQGMSIGDINNDSRVEIIFGNSDTSGSRYSNLYFVDSTNESVDIVATYNLSQSADSIYSTDVGDILPDEGLEVVYGTNFEGVVGMLNSTMDLKWEEDLPNPVTSVKMASLGGVDYVLVGTSGGVVKALNVSDGNTLYEYNQSALSVNDMAVGNLIGDERKEIAIATAGNSVYILNETLDSLGLSKDVGSGVKAVGMGDITSDEGTELVIGTADRRIIALNVNESGMTEAWNSTFGSQINTLDVGNAILDLENNTEIVLGTHADKMVHTLYHNGTISWSFTAISIVYSVIIGEIMADEVGNEVAAGDGNLYIFNFEYFPTNLTIFVNDTKAWNTSGKLRTTVTAMEQDLVGDINDFLDGCTPDASGNCDVPLVFHSDFKGKLNISQINVSYAYNLSAQVSKNLTSAWSRRSNISAGEPVGIQVYNVTFSGVPSENLTVWYLGVNENATSCDFNYTSYDVSTVEGVDVCDISASSLFFEEAESINSSDNSFLFWDDTMNHSVPIHIENSSDYYSTTGIPDGYTRQMNLTLYADNGTFTWVTANWTVDDSEIAGEEFLKMFDGGECDLTPPNEQDDCDSDSVNYAHSTTCSQYTYYSCKKEVDGNMYFKWVQSELDSDRNMTYQVGGSYNLGANLSNLSVSPNATIWGSNFTFSANVSDRENDGVNLSLWVHNDTDWTLIESANTTNGTVNFVIPSNKSWTGDAQYLFEYYDFNSSNSSQWFHTKRNTTAQNFTVQKHVVDIIYDEALGAAGNDTSVFRNSTANFAVYLNDTNSKENVSGAACTLWVNGTPVDTITSNTSGHCAFEFVPNQSFSVGPELWKIGIVGDHDYADVNSSSYNLTIRGWLHPEMINSENSSVYRGQSSAFQAKLVDGYGQRVESDSYNCTFNFSGTDLGDNMTSSGNCTVFYTPNCTGVGGSVGVKNLTVTVSRTGTDDYYNLSNTSALQPLLLKDTLTVTIGQPMDANYYKGSDITLNATISDSCTNVSGATVNWYLINKNLINVTLSDTSNENRTDFPVVLNGSQFSQYYYNLEDWTLRNTRILYGGAEFPVSIYPWTDATKTTQNDSQSVFTNNSEVVFKINLSAGLNKTFEFDLRYPDDSTYNVSYNFKNAGFDAGNFSYWTTTVCVNSGCGHNVTSSGSEKYANLSADGGSAILSQEMPNLTYQTTLQVKYKAWGEFDAGYPGDLYVDVGGAICNLTPEILEGVDEEGYVAEPENWTISNCTNTSFASARNISVVLLDEGTGGDWNSSTHALIDYVCFVDEDGNCVDFHSGYSPQAQLNLRKSLGEVNGYSFVGSDEVGRRNIVAEASKAFYDTNHDVRFFNLTGFSELKNLTVDSDYCTECALNSSQYLCMSNATVALVANVADNFTSEGIYNFSVAFYNNTSSIGNNTTSTLGLARLYTSLGSSGNQTFSSNISDQPEVFYNVTGTTEREITVLIDNGTTSGNASLNVSDVSVDGVTCGYNYTLPVLWTLNNTGGSGMYMVSISSPDIEGINISNISCSPINASQKCEQEFNITVTADALATNHTLVFNATWRNGDGTNSTVNASLTLRVSDTKRVLFNETNVSLVVPISTARSVNFTVLNYGNVNLSGVYYNLSGANSSLVYNWSTFLENASNITKCGLKNMTLTISVPANETYIGVYDLNLTATIPNCTGNCSASLPFTLNVTSLDWLVEPETNLSKTIGLKEEINKFGELLLTTVADTTYTYNMSLTKNDGTNLSFLTLNETSPTTETTISVSNPTPHLIEIFYNTSVSPNTTGTFNYTLRIENNNASAAPPYREISLYLKIINFTVDIISPNQSSPFGESNPINATDNVSIQVDAKIGETPIGENISWTVVVGGQDCNESSSVYNNTSKHWELVCTAPEIPYNPLKNDLVVSGNYSTLDVSLSDTEEDAVIYEDVLEPWFSGVSAAFLNYVDNTSSATFRVNVTDNQNISSVWAIVTFPDGTNVTLDSSNYTSSARDAGDFDSKNYAFTMAHSNIVGDYDIYVYANDTESYQNFTRGWFDIYLPITVSGNLTDANGTAINSTIEFYRGGYNQSPTYYMDTRATHGDAYNWTLHKRDYDVKFGIFGQEVVLLDVDFNVTENSTSAPFSFDYFANNSAPDISNILLPNTANRQNILLAIVVNSSLNLSGANFVLNYTDALEAGSFTEDLLEVFVCENWSYENRTCLGGEFAYLAGTSNLSSSNPNTAQNTFNFSSNHLSAYAIAESSYPNIWGSSPPDDSDDSSGGGGGSSGDDEEEATVSCGNGICELGENADNCPEDCSNEFPLEVDTNLEDVRMFLGENKSYWLSFTNNYVRDITATISLSENLAEFISPDQSSVKVYGESEEEVGLAVSIPENLSTGTYGGYIVLRAEDSEKSLPVTLRVLESAKPIFSVEVELLSAKLSPGDNLSFVVKLANLGGLDSYPINLTYIVKDQVNDKIVVQAESNTTLETTALIQDMLALNLTEEGDYTLEVWANYNDKSIMDMAAFEVVKPLFESPLTVALLVLALAMAVLVGGTYIWNYYRAWKKEKGKQERYLYPLDYQQVPKAGFKVGKFAGRSNFFFYDPRDLSTHLIAAGATGAGKSVSASVFAEEALDQKVPVIVFDPTAQWTGFVKPLRDKNLIARYKNFGMSEYDIRSYPGLIYDVDDPNFKLEVKKFINPGEITVFCLNKLKPGEYDVAVKNIISTLFAENWEESTELKAIFIFDEVHRLLEKYGGSGGYVALEKAAREFRKWGLGIMMCSQVLADFKEAIAGNVLTEIQLNTKSLTDIDKVKTKYGEHYAERIARMGVGAGLFQHPKYNNGKPFFVEFRPTKHDPHKITDQELALYKDYTQRLDAIGEKIARLKEAGKYVENFEIDYKLALNKLKRGNFRMSEIYIASLEKSLENL